MNIPKSIELFKQAEGIFPGREILAEGQPFFIERGAGPFLFDVDGNRYIDYVLARGQLVIGHAQPFVVNAIQQAVQNGTTHSAPGPLEIQLAQGVMECMPGFEMIDFVNSGSEACVMALRLARTYTGREKIVRFEGCHYGQTDLLLENSAAEVLVARYNDLDALDALFKHYPEQIAAVIVEPVAGNMGVVPPVAGFLEGLRSLTTENGALLIFDEVTTGFRAHLAGAQGFYGIQPDLTTLGRVIGGGLALGAYGGKREIMQKAAPAGRPSGNPLAISAGIATLNFLKKPGVWEQLEKNAAALEFGLVAAAEQAGVAVRLARVGAMFSIFFSETSVSDWPGAQKADALRYEKFSRKMLEGGVYLPSSQFDAGFISSAHTQIIVDMTLSAADEALRGI